MAWNCEEGFRAQVDWIADVGGSWFSVGPGRIINQVGRIDRPRLHQGHSAVAGRVPAPVRDYRKAWPASTFGDGPDQRSLRRRARYAAGIRGDLSRLLLRTDRRGAAEAGNGFLQPAHAARSAAGDYRRDGTERL